MLNSFYLVLLQERDTPLRWRVLERNPGGHGMWELLLVWGLYLPQVAGESFKCAGLEGSPDSGKMKSNYQRETMNAGLLLYFKNHPVSSSQMKSSLSLASQR